jgi:hypothetical protein
VGVNKPSFVTGMVARPNSIDVTSPCAPSNGVSIVLRSWWKGEVHEVSDRRLASAAIGISHCSLVILAKPLIIQYELTDSAMASSSASLGFLEFLCCFFWPWLLRADAWIGLEWLVERLELVSKLGETT